MEGLAPRGTGDLEGSRWGHCGASSVRLGTLGQNGRWALDSRMGQVGWDNGVLGSAGQESRCLALMVLIREGKGGQSPWETRQGESGAGEGRASERQLGQQLSPAALA